MFHFSSNSGDEKLWSEQSPSSGFLARLDGDVFVTEERISNLQVNMRWFGGSRPYLFIEVGGERAEEFVRLLTAFWGYEGSPSVVEGFVQVFAWFKAPWQNPFWDGLLKVARDMEPPF